MHTLVVVRTIGTLPHRYRPDHGVAGTGQFVCPALLADDKRESLGEEDGSQAEKKQVLRRRLARRCREYRKGVSYSPTVVTTQAG